MLVLVTGASGYIGKHVVKAFLDAGDVVLACDFQNKVDERATFVDVDILSGDSDLYKKLGSPDLVVHMAWQNGFVHNSHTHMTQLSAHYTFIQNLALAGCKRIAVMGSMHEVGFWEGAIDENTPCNPLSLYGIAKNALRQSLMLLSKELDFALYWLRAYYIYGDDTQGNSIFSKITQAAAEGKKEFPFTTGKNLYDFIHVSDLAAQIVAASKQSEITGIINTCNGTPISLAEQIETFIADKGFDIRLKYGAFPDRAYDSPGVWGDSKRIRSILQKKEVR